MAIPSPSETLNELGQLRNSEFGRPHPRHGLLLLHWFAHECFSFNNNLATLWCNPAGGDYGFHYFDNREQLLPLLNDNYDYFEVGNLNEPRAMDLPSYVRNNYNRNESDSNSDRIILSVGPGNIIDRIYATEHKGRGFNRERTYRISKGLLLIIKDLDLDTFLWEMEEPPINSSQAFNPHTVSSVPASNVRPANMEVTAPRSNPSVVIDLQQPGESSNPPRREKRFWDYCRIL